MTAPAAGGVLARRLGTTDAVLVGLGAMLGAGIFSAPAPAARAAGAWLPVAVLVAAFVAWCNATSTARLAAVYPRAGGTYVYAGRLLGPGWGHLAGWSFVTGKTASCAAMALTVGAYAWPAQPRLGGTIALAVAVALGTGGVQRGARLNRVLLIAAAGALAVVVLAAVTGVGTGRVAASGAVGGSAGLTSAMGLARVSTGTHLIGVTAGLGGLAGIPTAAGLMFFAFAGYARLATLGEEVREPARTIPRAIALALLCAVAIYLAVTASALLALGPDRLAASPAPLAAVVSARGWEVLLPLVRLGAVAASGGALLSLLLGVSRTAFAMARDRYLPHQLTAVRRGVPHHAEQVVALIVSVLVWTVDLRWAIGFSSLGVLVYYLLANLSARRLGTHGGGPPRWLTAAGTVGCVVLALTLPVASVLEGVAVLGFGVIVRFVLDRRRPAAQPSQVP